MSAASTRVSALGLRELQDTELAALIVQPDGIMRSSNVPLPAVFHSDRLRDDDAFIQFCLENRPLQFERYPEGEILVITPVGGKGSNWEAYISTRLLIWAEDTRTGIAFGPDCGFRFGNESVLAPDAAWVATEAWNSLSSTQQEKFLPFSPNFLIELRSPSDRGSMIEAKMRLWMSKGVTLAWMIDPKRKLAAIYRKGKDPEILQQPEFLMGEGPVAGFRLDLQRFWA